MVSFFLLISNGVPSPQSLVWHLLARKQFHLLQIINRFRKFKCQGLPVASTCKKWQTYRFNCHFLVTVTKLYRDIVMPRAQFSLYYTQFFTTLNYSVTFCATVVVKDIAIY